MAVSLSNTAEDENRTEAALQGSGHFPYACYRIDLNHDLFPWHWHEELEAAVVSEGKVCIHIGSEKKVLTRGEGAFINTGALHEYTSADPDHASIHSMVFTSDLILPRHNPVYSKYLQPLLTSSCKGVFLTDSTWMKKCLRNLENAWQACASEPFGYEMAVGAHMSLFMREMLQHISLEDSRHYSDQLQQARIRMMLRWIQNHYSEPITVKDIAAAASVSESEALRCFHAVLDETPNAYLRQYRMRMAARFLLRTDRPIPAIAAACGFNDISYFTKTFHQFYGITPARFRKKSPDSIFHESEQ